MYPVSLGENFLQLQISSPDAPPVFPTNSENEIFYKLLTGEDVQSGKYSFALLMIQSKKLLDSSHGICTIEELAAKKEEFQSFVANHCDLLQHSDMVRRLINQYFMMHEYVDYHVPGAPSTDIRVRYQNAVGDLSLSMNTFTSVVRKHS